MVQKHAGLLLPFLVQLHAWIRHTTRGIVQALTCLHRTYKDSLLRPLKKALDPLQGLLWIASICPLNRRVCLKYAVVESNQHLKGASTRPSEQRG